MRLWCVIFILCTLFFVGCDVAKTPASLPSQNAKEARLSDNDIITISFIGDNVLGDYYGSSGETFNWQFANINRDYGYFFANVQSVLANDDMTLGNLECPLTTHNGDRLIKPFAFKGEPSYVEILKQGSIEAVNIANNHTRDYGMKGFEDTKTHLKNAGIIFSGEGELAIYKIKGKNIGMAGHRGWHLSIKPQVKNDINKLRQMGADIVIFTFHWGEEREHYPNAIQKELGRFAIDNGADIVIGHHPHVLQGIEEYKGKKIVYSLGNFVYGGAKNPKDKDTMIYQVRFAFGAHKAELKAQEANTYYINLPHIEAFVEQEEYSELHNIIPAHISGEKSRNNYQPVIADGASKAQILKRVETYSK